MRPDAGPGVQGWTSSHPAQCGQGLPEKRHGAQLPATLSGCVNRHRLTGWRGTTKAWSLLPLPASVCPAGPGSCRRAHRGRQLLGVHRGPQAARTPPGQPGLTLHARREGLWGRRLACVACFRSRQLLLREPRPLSELSTVLPPSLPARAGCPRLSSEKLLQSFSVAHQRPLVKAKTVRTDCTHTDLLTGQDK